jgi:predicted  nucleic acid-binding Zn ribbon protein
MMKMEAIKKMAKGGEKKMKEHMAECPKCKHKWMMGEDEYEDESEDYEEED